MTDTTEPAFHPDYLEVYDRLLRDVGAREQPVQRAAADSQQAIARLASERQLLAGQGQEKAAQDLVPKIRAQQDALQEATRQLKALREERDSIANSAHPELRAVLIQLSASADTRLRARQEAEYEAAHSAFARLVTPEAQATFESLVTPLVTPEAQAAAVRLLHAAHAIDRDPSGLAAALVSVRLV